MCVCTSVCAPAMVLMWDSQDNSEESVFSLQVGRLGSKCLCLLSPLISL